MLISVALYGPRRLCTMTFYKHTRSIRAYTSNAYNHYSYTYVLELTKGICTRVRVYAYTYATPRNIHEPNMRSLWRQVAGPTRKPTLYHSIDAERRC